MSSASLADLVAVLTTTFQRPEPPQDLSPELDRLLSAYVARAKKGDGDALQEDLRSVFRHNVLPQPHKLGPFMAVLRHLGPAMANDAHLAEWFQTALLPFVDEPASSRAAAADARHFATDALVYQDDAPDARERGRLSARLCAVLVRAYMARTDPRAAGAPLQTQDQAARQLQSILVAFAREKPRDFFVSVDGFLLDPDTRLQALGLLATFLEQQHARLHLVLQTAVVEHLLKCLLNDTATVVVSAALRCLIMLLPHIPATVATQLPSLFLIYSRCLCWEKFSASSTKAQRDLVTDDRVRRDSGSEEDLDPGDDDDDDDDDDAAADPTWQTLRTVPDTPESSAPELLHYFTYLYGLYPLNLLSYVRKPRKYLKAIDFPGADYFDLDQTVIRTRTEQFQRVHLLHSNIFTTTAEDELSENRWLKAEPSEVIAECHGLYVGEQPTLASPGPPPAAKLPALPNFLSLESLGLTGHPRPATAVSQEAAEVAADSPTLAPADVEKPSTEQSAIPDDLYYLQRALMLLRNELTFERYLKQQHVAAIAQLKRNHVKAVTVEAETATLINANRALQKKLGDANSFNERMQKETQARRIHTKHTEEQLTAKIRSLKTELADQNLLHQRLAQATSDSFQLRQLLVQSEARETSQQEELDTFGAQLKDLESKRQEVLELEKQLRTLRVQVLGFESAHAEHESVRQELESTKYILHHRDQELEQSKSAHQAKVAELELRVEEATQDSLDPPSQPLADITAELQAMLAESRADLAKAKRAYITLWEEHEHLLANYHDITGSSDMLPLSGSPVPRRLRTSSNGPEYLSQQGSVSSRQAHHADQAYYTDRGLEQSELYAPHMRYGRIASPVSSLNQSYPPARPLRPEAYQQRAANANPMSRTQGTHYNEHALHPSATRGAAHLNFGSEFAPSITPTMREASKSAFSFTSDDQGSMQDQDKIKPKSEVRVYGRGGAQNIKMKNKDKPERADKSEKSPRTNGIRGLKGLM